MAKIYERLLSTIKLWENRRDSFDPQGENLLGEDCICMVNLLEIPQVIFYFFFDYMFDFFWVVSDEKFCFVKQASKSKSRHYRYTVRSIHVKL